MSGYCSGVQQSIRAVEPIALYVYCYAHCLNLALVDSTKSVSESAEFLEMLHVFQESTHIIYAAAIHSTP